MADGTKIEWTEATWNPITGCSLASPGCTNCYAMQLAGTRLAHHWSRKGLTQDSKAGPVWNGQVRFNKEWLDQPLRWKRPRMIFVCAHGDLFHESVPDEWIDRIFAFMALCLQHTFQVLTKRSARMRDYLNGFTCDGSRRFHVADAAGRLMDDGDNAHATVAANCDWPLPNVWLGVSVEDQQRANERIPDLLATPAAIRWISAEPLLGPVDLESAWAGENALESECWGDCAWCDNGHPPLHNCRKGRQSEAEVIKGRSGIDWVVAGGESGPSARPMHPDWARSLRDQCAAADVPFFFKQWGEWADHFPFWSFDPSSAKFDAGTSTYCVGKKRAGRLLDGIEHNGMPE